MAINIDEEVAEVLARAEMSEKSMTLPEGQLERSLYMKVNKVLEAAGGKWNSRLKCHLFEKGGVAKLQEALLQGKITSKKSEQQQFYTPGKLASYVVEKADVKNKSILEPSAGQGALAAACLRRKCQTVVCVENDAVNAEILRQKGFCPLVEDFLTIDPAAFGLMDRVVMNPPFTKNQDIIHVSHALRFVKPGGRLVAIMAGNVERNWFKTLPLKHEIETLPENSFKESGTSVKTILLTVDLY